MIKLTLDSNSHEPETLCVRAEAIASVCERGSELNEPLGGVLSRKWTEIQVGNFKYDVKESAEEVMRFIEGDRWGFPKSMHPMPRRAFLNL